MLLDLLEEADPLLEGDAEDTLPLVNVPVADVSVVVVSDGAGPVELGPGGGGGSSVIVWPSVVSTLLVEGVGRVTD